MPRKKAYDGKNMKRTSVLLDPALVGEAKEILGTATTTETVHRALEEIIRRERLRSLAQWDLGGLTLDDLWEMRKPRTFDLEQ
jgi:Arc/MetJ family transcription regulator